MKAVNASNRSGFDSLLKLYRETDVAEEKGRLLGNQSRLWHCFTVSIGANFSQSHLVFFQEHHVTKLSFWTTKTFYLQTLILDSFMSEHAGKIFYLFFAASMASSPDPEIVLEALNFILSSEVNSYVLHLCFSLIWHFEVQ